MSTRKKNRTSFRRDATTVPVNAQKNKTPKTTKQNESNNPFLKYNPETNEMDLLPLNMSSLRWSNDATTGAKPRSAQKKLSDKKQNPNRLKDNPYFKFNPATNEYDLLPLNPSCLSWADGNGETKSAQKKKENSLKKNPFFKFNSETNEFDLQPLNFQFLTGEKVSQHSSKKSIPKITVTPCSGDPTERESKLRKIDHCVRKELFKMPAKKPQPKRKSLQKDRRSVKGESPLGYPFQSPRRPLLKFAPQPTVPEESDSKLSGDAEFLELEKMCGVETETNQSPVSSVCKMMEHNMQLDSTKKVTQKPLESVENVDVLLEIEEILENEKLKYDELKDQIKIFDKIHQDNISKIKDILQRLKSKDEKTDDDKENSGSNHRRSTRLMNKSSEANSNCSKVLSSPVMLKAGDLRKKTLTKSLVDKYQKYQIQSPRIEKALSLYNSMRKDVCILSTPKINRHLLVATPGSASSNNLSMRVQKQCLLLQDTPVAK